MSPLIELRPNRDLLDANFSGYKLSLEPVPVFTHRLESGIDHLLPGDDQYSFLHVKLFGLHNHLYGDPWSADDVYYIDNKWRLRKNITNPNTGRLDGMTEVWELPSHRERKPGHYNTSMSFASSDLAVVTDGAGTLHLVSTGNRAESTSWKVLFSDEVCGKEKAFVVANCRLSEINQKRYVHCLLQHIDEATVKSPAGETTLFKTILEWITLAEGENSWSISCVRKISGDGGLDYAAFEVGCQSLYIASNKQFRFIIDSEVPVELSNPMEPSEGKSRFSWQQTSTDLTVWIPVPTDELIDEKKLEVTMEEDSIRVAVGDRVLLSGHTWQHHKASLASWSLDKANVELKLCKAEAGVRWQELVQGDVDGEEIVVATQDGAGDCLAHLTSETEVASSEEAGCSPAFNAEQLEDCDTLPDISQLVRLDTHSHTVTHQINLGGHQWLFNVQLAPDRAPAVCLRHDVDGCVWQLSQPVAADADVWPSEHVGTFLAFGYVQASKTQRKFTVSAPDMSYVAICEASRHVYLYRQPSPVDGDLRNRTTGHRVSQIAKQQLINLDLQNEILGVHATNANIYVLTADTLLTLQIS